ncbi:MAG: AAA family ATPase [bacterium]
MSSKLKNLYKYLIENRKHEVKRWHDDYKTFCEEVDKIRDRIKNTGEGLSHETDKGFLRKLLFERENGIASCGQSTLKEDYFEEFISNEDFISALQEFILDPNRENYQKFGDAWSAQRKGNRPVRVNRVAAACTLDVSTTVVFEKFNYVFKWLIREGIIPEYPGEEDQEDWYLMNKYLMEKIRAEFNDELQPNEQGQRETDEFYLSQFVWELYKNISNPFSLKKQIVKYGAPGTGKTYEARQQTSLLFDIWKEEFAPNSAFKYEDHKELIQFHPSFSYEDFIEGLRPVLDENGTAQLTLQNGIFKEFCRKAGKWEIDVFNLGINKEWEEITIDELDLDKLSGDHWQHIFEISDSSTLVSDAVPPFFFIIDEINRAELSRVFGELMYCLEYRGIKDGLIKTQYANLNNADTGMLKTDQGYRFFIPSNIYLIGTMNTIDRSVESFDFALRRRFHWEEMTPNIELLEGHLKKFCEDWAPLANNLKQLNKKIAEERLLGQDYQIGHAYLMDLKYSSSLTVAEVRKRVWDDFIRPLLQEYLRGTGKNDLIDSFKEAFWV